MEPWTESESIFSHTYTHICTYRVRWLSIQEMTRHLRQVMTAYAQYVLPARICYFNLDHLRSYNILHNITLGSS